MKRTLVNIPITFFLLSGIIIGCQPKKSTLQQQSALEQSATNVKTTKSDHVATGEGIRDTVYQNGIVTTIKGHFIENDTTFFLKTYFKEDGKKYLNTQIYIEPDRESIRYKEIIARRQSDSGYQEKDLNGWYMLRQKYNLPSLQKVALPDIPTDWISLHLYKDHYYVYSPCQIDVPNPRWLTDTVLIYDDLEPYFIEIRKIEKQSPSLYHIELGRRGYDTICTTPTQLYIHIIDTLNKTSIWEHKDEGHTHYELMIPAESAKNFDMIVCNCLNLDDELDFEEPNFLKLLEQSYE